MATSAGEETNEGEGGGSAAPVASAGKTKGMTPGQRLAAKKAAKAARKKELREAEAASQQPDIPEEVQQVADDLSSWMERNRQRVLVTIVAVLALGAGLLFFNRTRQGEAAAAAAALEEAVELATAPVNPEDPKEGEGGDPPVFASEADRFKKAAEAYQNVRKSHPGSAAATWSLLGEAAATLAAGKPAEARALFETALKEAGADAAVKLRATEGAGLTLEAEKKYDEAAATFQKLAGLAGGAEKDLADYHLARMHLAKGERDKGKELLKQLYDRLSEAKDGAPPARYLRGQVEIRLMELDSSLVDKGTAAPAGGDPISQERLQQLLRQLQQQQQRGGTP